MVDATHYVTPSAKDGADFKLRKHCEAIRRNKDILWHVFKYLSEDPPNASAAAECFEEIHWQDKIDIWSVSTKNGGIWNTWERHAIKEGELSNAYEVWKAGR
jgi:hypothetical protein